jgi:hypothetical protein
VSRVQLPIIVTLNKLLSVDDTGDQGDAELVEGESGIPALQAIEGASLDVWNNVTTLREPVYEGPNPEDPEIDVGLMLTNEQGRFEGWVERSSLRVEVTYESYYYEENLDMVPATNGSVDTDWIANEAVTTAKIDDAGVTTAKLANGSVNNTKLAADSVDATHIQDNAVGQNAIANNAVGSGEIIDGSVGSSEISAAIKDAAAATASLRTLGTGATQAAVGSTAVLTSDSRLFDTRTPTDNSVSTVKIQNDAVTADKLADSVGTDASRAVTTNHVRDNAVTTAKVANDAITDAKLADHASNDASRAVGTDHIKDSAVTSAKILDGTIVHGDVNSANIDSRTGQSAGVLTNRTEDNSTPSLRTLGRNAGQAAPGNDPRFTYLVPEASAVITSHIADGAVTSPKFRPTIGSQTFAGSATVVTSSADVLGKNLQNTSFTVSKNTRVLVWASWGLSMLSASQETSVQMYIYCQTGSPSQSGRIVHTNAALSYMRRTPFSSFATFTVPSGTHTINQFSYIDSGNQAATFYDDTSFSYILVDTA